MNRRDFLRRLGGAAATVTLSPLLDLAEVIAPPSVALIDQDAFVAWCYWSFKLKCDNPAACAVIEGIRIS